MTNFEKNNAKKHTEKKGITDGLTDSSAITCRLA